MTPGELGSGPAEAASRRAARVTGPRVLILAAAALVLTNIPLTRYGSAGQPGYFWSSLSVLLAVWQLWDHRRLAWAALTVATAATLLFYGLSVAGVINTRPARMVDPDHRCSRHPGAGYLAQSAHPPMGH